MMRIATTPCLVTLLVWLFAIGATAQGPTEFTFDLRIERGQVARNARLIRVRQGDAIRLRWTSDRPIILHLHGYDIESMVEPGSVAEMSFVARATGRYSVEEHKPNARGSNSHGEAAIIRIEVYPR